MKTLNGLGNRIDQIIIGRELGLGGAKALQTAGAGGLSPSDDWGRNVL